MWERANDDSPTESKIKNRARRQDGRETRRSVQISRTLGFIVMRNLTVRLIAAERRPGSKLETGAHAAFRVCEKLRQPLCTFAGVAGFRSLLLRALVLAKARDPGLGGVQITSNGTFEFAPESEAQLDAPEAAQAAATLVDELMGLLFTFIGEALTLRLVHDVWPKAALKDPTPGRKLA